MKYNILILLAAIGLSSMACLSTVYPTTAPTVETTSTDVPTTGKFVRYENTITPAVTHDGAGERCLVVTAVQSLHLRIGPSVKSAAPLVLLHDQVVVLISDSDPDWYLVMSGNKVGYARSAYLEETECEK